MQAVPLMQEIRRKEAVGRLLLVSMLLLLIAVGCQSSPRGDRPKSPRRTPDLPPSASDAERAAWRKAQEEEIYEAVVRHAFTEYGEHMLGEEESARWQRKLLRCTFFLDIDGRDPSDEFMKRFAGEKPTVRKASEVDAFVKEKGEAIFRPDTLNLIPSLYLGKVLWHSDTSVKVEFLAYLAPREQAWWERTVVREEGRWVVKPGFGPRVT